MTAQPSPAGAYPALSQTGLGPRDESRDRPRVLLVDDEESVLRSLRRLFRREPYRIESAGSGPEALKLMDEGLFNMVITDQRMPGMTGTELLEVVRQRWPDTVRIVLSGYSQVSAILDSINRGAVYKYLTKPWNDEELKLNVRRAIDQQALIEENRRLVRCSDEQNKRLEVLNRILDRRAEDASVGLSLAQEQLETIDAAVIVVDTNGLIVSANNVACRMIPDSRGLFGRTARESLPINLWNDALGPEVDLRARSGGRIRTSGRDVQWKRRPLKRGRDAGQVMTLWEEV